MENNHKMLILKEFRSDPIGFDEAIKRRLRVMVDRLALFYLSRIEFEFKLPNTNVLLFNIFNLDNATRTQADVYYNLSSDESHIGGMMALLSEFEFLKHDDEYKRKVILKLIHESLVKLAELHSGTEILHLAFKKAISSDFYADSYREYLNNTTKIACKIQTRENWGSADHRLVVKDTISNTFKIFSIVRTAYPFFDEMPGLTQENMWETVLNIPQIFNPIKWEDEKFVMYWGKEKYVFNPDTEKITLE